jgi:flagellar L-ring protein FlgH
MKIKILIFIQFLILASCGTNRKMVTDDEKNTAIEEIKRDIASTQEIVTEKDPLNPSLWTGKGTDSYLFTNSTEKKVGDLITIDVYKSLRNEIATELKIDAETASYEGPEGEKGKAEEEKAATETETTSDDKPSDQISTVVEEDVNQTHLLLKGKKTVVFRGKKKLLEIKALVAKKDIKSDDRVESKNIMETTIKVLR